MGEKKPQKQKQTTTKKNQQKKPQNTLLSKGKISQVPSCLFLPCQKSVCLLKASWRDPDMV